MSGAFESLLPGGRCCPEGAICEDPEAIPHAPFPSIPLSTPENPLATASDEIILPTPFPIDFGCALSELEITDDRCRGGTVYAAGVVAPRNEEEGDSCFPVLKLDIHGLMVCTEAVAGVVVEKRIHPSALPELEVIQGGAGAEDGECAQAMCFNLQLPDVRCETPTVGRAEVIPALVGPSGKMRANAVPDTSGTRGFRHGRAAVYGCGFGALDGAWKVCGEKNGYAMWARIDGCGLIYAETRRTIPQAWIFNDEEGKPQGWRSLVSGPFGGYAPYIRLSTSAECQDPPPEEAAARGTAANWPLSTTAQWAITLIPSGVSIGVLASGKCGGGSSQPDNPVYSINEDPCKQDWAFEVVVPWSHCTTPEVNTTVAYGTRADPFRVAVVPKKALRPALDAYGWPQRDGDGNVVYAEEDDQCNLAWDFDVMLPQAACKLPVVVVNTRVAGDTSGFEARVTTAEPPTTTVSTSVSTVGGSVIKKVTTSVDEGLCAQKWEFFVEEPSRCVLPVVAVSTRVTGGFGARVTTAEPPTTTVSTSVSTVGGSVIKKVTTSVDEGLCAQKWDFFVDGTIRCEAPTVKFTTRATGGFDVDITPLVLPSGDADWCSQTWEFFIDRSAFGTSGTGAGTSGTSGTSGEKGDDGEPGSKYAIVPIAGEWVGLTCMEASEALFFDRLTFECSLSALRIKLPAELVEACEAGSIFVASAVSSRPEAVGAVIRDGYACVERVAEGTAQLTLLVAGIRKGCPGRYPRFSEAAAKHNTQFWKRAVDPTA